MRVIRWILAIVAGTTTLGGAAVWYLVRPWWHRWGVDPTEAMRPLPGDDVVPDAGVSDTRAVTIEASPADVWPWLVQMGYGRGGWYSYDAVDMRGSSAHSILPEFQSLAVGDIVATHPDGGFEVRIVEPGRALVLFMDSGLARAQAQHARDAAVTTSTAGSTPANLAAAGSFMGAAQPTEFAATWGFVLEPAGDGRCRLIERVRVRFDGGDRPWTKFTLPMLGFGVFAMMRKQLLGIRARAERAAGATSPTAAPADA